MEVTMKNIKYLLVLVLIFFVCIGAGYTTKIYFVKGKQMYVTSGGEIIVQKGGLIKADSGTIKLADRTLSETDIDKLASVNQPKIVGSDNVVSIKKYQVAVDVGSLAGSSMTDTTITVTGLATSDIVYVNTASDLESGLAIVSARVSAADTLKLRIYNAGTEQVDPATFTLNIVAVKTE
jgi:hypothetical protein